MSGVNILQTGLAGCLRTALSLRVGNSLGLTLPDGRTDLPVVDENTITVHLRRRSCQLRWAGHLRLDGIAGAFPARHRWPRRWRNPSVAAHALERRFGWLRRLPARASVRPPTGESTGRERQQARRRRSFARCSPEVITVNTARVETPPVPWGRPGYLARDGTPKSPSYTYRSVIGTNSGGLARAR